MTNLWKKPILMAMVSCLPAAGCSREGGWFSNIYLIVSDSIGHDAVAGVDRILDIIVYVR